MCTGVMLVGGKGLGGRWKGSLGVLVAGGRERWNYGEERGGGFSWLMVILHRVF